MSFKVFIEPSGHCVTAMEGESILDAVLHNGITIPYGCRNAVCGSCKGKLLEGEIDYDGFDPMGLSEEEIAAGMVLFCRAIPQTDVRIEANVIKTTVGFEIKRMPSRVATLELLAPDVMKLQLKLPANDRMQYLAGQYIDIILRDGRRRSFSIANAPHDDEFIELHIRHVEGGAFTDYIFNKMKEKEILRIEGPLGGFYLREDSDRPMIFVAGGTGFAPIKGIIEHAFAKGVTRPMTLYWGARARVDLYMNELAESWQQHDNFHYVPVLASAEESDHWQGRSGMVHEAVIADFPNLSGFDVYAGGPPVMVNAARDAFFVRGLPNENFYYDSFDFAQDPLKGGKPAAT